MAAQEQETLLLDDKPGSGTRPSGRFDRLLRFLFPEWCAPPTAQPPTAAELALVIVGCILVSVGAVICYAWQEAPGNSKDPLKAYSAGQWANMLLSNGLITAALLFIGLPQGQGALAALPNDRNLRAAVFPAIVVFCWLTGNLINGNFNPLSFTIVVLFAYLFVHSAHYNPSSTFTSSDAIPVLALGAMIDLRWCYSIWGGLGEFGYDWWGLSIALLIAAAFATARPILHVSYSYIPQWRDSIGLLGGIVLLSILIIPAGLLSGFLQFNVQGNAMLYISYYVENFFTIALIEELIFRVFLTQAVAFGPFQTFQWKELWGVLVSSVLFGVWHWPREPELENKLLYGVFATLAGVVYAFAYRTSTNILSPMLLHALVDTVWGALLHS